MIPVPYVDVRGPATCFDQTLSNTILGLSTTPCPAPPSLQATILALSIQPYINASIIIQLLTIAIPALERMAKEEGEDGKKKLERITRYTTVGLGAAYGRGLLPSCSTTTTSSSADANFLSYVVIVLAFTAGSALVMWLGEQITEYGIGNGISMILFANIISRIPDNVISLVTNLSSGAMKWWGATITAGRRHGSRLVLLIVFINDAERRIPIQYAKRVVGRKVYGGQNTNLPIKVNMSGVMPIIFAQSIASLPATILCLHQCCRSGVGFWSTLRAIFELGQLVLRVPVLHPDHRLQPISTPPFSTILWRLPTT